MVVDFFRDRLKDEGKVDINPRMITLARESRGLTQTELSKAMKIPQGTLSKMELYGMAAEKHLSKLSECLNYPENFFYQYFKIMKFKGCMGHYED